jgi:hypothetical protein
MSCPDDLASGHIARALANVRAAGACLLCPTPESLEQVLGPFRNAVECLRMAHGTLSKSRRPAALRAELDELRRELRRAAVLIEAGASHTFGLAWLLHGAACYTARCEPTLPQRAGRLAVEA